MSTTREQTCQAAAAKLTAAAPSLRGLRAVVGFDGFVDEIIAVVDKRHDTDHFDPIRTIAELGRKISNAAGDSSNYELVSKQRKLGGNGPIMANALACLGLDVTYLGALGYPNLDPVFRDFATRAKVHSIAEPGHTDALEFDDGKIMLGKYESLNDVSWENLVARVGRQDLETLFGGATIVGMVNWTMLPRMSQIWGKLIDEVFASTPARRAGMLFIDLADPEKRTPADILGALRSLARFQEHVDVTLGLNLKEEVEIATVLGLPVRSDPEAAMQDDAATIRERLDVACVVIHPRRGSTAATRDESARFAGPFINQPMISTGAGDHFNAGFCLGQVLGLGLEESLCAGVATSGFYVRTAQSPTTLQLAEFVAMLPPPEA